MTELLGGKILYFHEILGTNLTGKTGDTFSTMELNEKFTLEGRVAHAGQSARMLFLSLGKLPFLPASTFDISVPGRIPQRKKCCCKTTFLFCYRQLLLAESQLLLSTVKPQVWDLEIMSKELMRIDH